MNPLQKIKNKLRQGLDGHMHEILSKGAIAFLLKIIGAGLAFGFHVAVARMLGAEGAGIYFLALTIITLMAVVARLGMDNSVTRFVAAHASINEWSAVKGVFRHAITLSLCLATLLAAGTYALASPLALHVFTEPPLAQPLALMALAIVPLAGMTIFARALQGLKNVRDSMLMQSVLIPGVAALLVLILAPSQGVSGAALAYLIAVSLSLLYGATQWYRSGTAHRATPPAFERRELLSSSMPLLGAMLTQQLTLALPVLLLGIWASSADVGLYSAANRTAALVSLVLMAANSIIAPKMAGIYKSGDMEALGKIARQSALLLTGMALPALLLFMLAPRWVMSLFGPQFSDAWLMLLIISFGQLINVMTGSVGFLLMMTGRETSFFSANLLALAICALCCVTLIPFYGGIGAALASAIALAIVNLLRVRHVHQELGIMTLPLLPNRSSR